MKKVLSLVLVLTLVLCTGTVALVASAYSDYTKAVLSVDKETVKVGETFELKIAFPEIYDSIGVFNIDIDFDTEAVSFDWDTITVVGYPQAMIEGLDGLADDHINIQLMDGDITAVYDENYLDGYITITGTALKDGKTDINFRLNGEDDDGNVGIDLALGDFENAHPMDKYVIENTSITIGDTTPVDPVDPDPVPDPTVWQVTLVYADGSEETIDVEEGQTIPADKLVLNPSAEYVYSWDGDVTAPIMSEATFTVVKTERTYAVDVNGDVRNMAYKSALVVTADEEKDGNAFAYWTKDGKVVSYDRTYKLLVYADTNLEAVYAESVNAEASAFIDTPYYTMHTDGKSLKMVSSLQVVLPAGVSVESFKIYRAVRTDGEALDADALIAKNSVANAGSNKFNAQGRLDYSILSSVDSVKYTDIVFVATLSDGSSVTSNVVTVGAQLA